MVSMYMGIASMVLLQAVRAGCAPRCTQPRRPGHCLCLSLGGFTWLWFAFATCGVSPCHNGNGHE